MGNGRLPAESVDNVAKVGTGPARCVREGGAMPEDEMHMSVLADEFPDTSYQTIVYYGMAITKP